MNITTTTFLKNLLILLIVSVAINSHAQQDPYYTHFKDVIQAYNPAGAGYGVGMICVSGLTHHQWRDYTDDTEFRGTDKTSDAPGQDVAPVTYNMNINSVFNLGKSGDQFLGAGLSIIDDKIGYTKSTAFMANFNYRKQFQGGFNEVSFGLGIGGTQWGWDDPKFKAKDLADPNIPANGGNQTELDMNIGLMYKQQQIGVSSFKNFYVGFSMTNINQAKYSVSVLTQDGQNRALNMSYVPHYYTIIGSDFDMGNIVLEPAILAKYGLLQGSYKPQIDLNMTALFANTFRGGIAYRQWENSDAVSVLLGYQKENIKIGYSYDITVSNIQKVSNGTHEIFVRYCIPISVAPPTKIIRESVRFL
ncbi:MAG: type IX secretion system membrane protein PorP/SprF [Bacteroidia bacterium]|nr:type IX secretion system membrane protein PorP/SprF [Bacteroidia bacterium]